MTRPRVLLADDHPGIVKALGRLLAEDCDVVEVVTDGGEVADAAYRLRPVVSVVDVNLPNASGLDICRRITAENPDAKVIVITGMLDEAIEEEARAAGASAFISKTTAGGALVSAIKKAWSEL